MKIYIYDRQTKTPVEEDAYKISGLLFLYKTLPGKLLTSVILKRRFISAAYGRMMKSKNSIKQISTFIEHYKIDLNEIMRPLSSFKSFNDFFIRELKPGARPVDETPTHLISPADSRLLVLDLAKETDIPVKGYWYHLNDLLKDQALTDAYKDGLCFIYRLAPSDYHRYGYIDNGMQEKVRKINGVLHSVNRIAIAEVNSIMAKNYRELTVLHTENFGDVIHIEVGALFVGKIIQRINNEYHFKKGEEKGWFEFGGSTVIQFFKKGIIIPDADIMEQSAKQIETLVKLNERVGVVTV
jgi:phosphatidylserine decarboxylase